MIDKLLAATAQLMRDYRHDWAFCGGWALDLYLNRVTRDHKDIDIAVWRKDQRSIGKYLRRRGWKMEITHQGSFSAWDVNEFIELPRHTVWCRHETHDPDFVELLFNEADETHFKFRRDPTITHALEQAIIDTPGGYRVLAPEIVLLYKSLESTRDHNQDDFDMTYPYLSDIQRNWLKDALHKRNNQHEWLKVL